MSKLNLPEGDKSICWICDFWEWSIEFAKYNGKKEASWNNECIHPLKYVATDYKEVCPGFKKESIK